MVIYRLKNLKSDRVYVGAAECADCISDSEFPPTLKKDLEEDTFATKIICELNSPKNIERKLNQLLAKESDPYNNEEMEVPKEEIEEEVPAFSIFELEDFEIG